MAHNDSHQASVPDVHIPDTEVILETTDLEGGSKKNKDLDFVNDWLNETVTVQSEIWRGKKLRERKPPPDRKQNNKIVPNINIYGPFVNQRQTRKSHFKSQNKTGPCSTRSRCSCKRLTSPASSYLAVNKFSKNIHTKTKKRERCPMRIAELAVPTKRQCIETWRQKSNVLPELMVERLKQQVMDQTPIVKIPEAIYCFQRGRSVSSKNCSFRWLSNKIKDNEALQPSHQMATRILCIVFAHKIAKILSNPLNLKLNSDLEKLSEIVSSDIAKIMPQRQCTFRKNPKFDAIHTDISNKIAVWITGILEETSLKLLEEELRVKMETEAQIETMLQFSDQFYTIIETIFQNENKMLSGQQIKSKDLEEEEGPVLDFLDDVVDNVINLCEPPQLQFESESDSSDDSKDALMEEELEQQQTQVESSDNKITKLEEIFNTEEASQGLTEDTDDSLIGSMENLTDSDHFRNEIGNIIDNITKESWSDIKSEEISPKVEIEHDINDGNKKEVSLEEEMESDINDGNIEDVSPKPEMEHDVNDENYEKVPPLEEIEHNIKDGNYKKVSPKEEMDHNIKDGNYENVLLNAEMEHNIKDGNYEEVFLTGEMEHNVNDGDNSPEADIEHDINEADIEHDINAANTDQIDDNLSNIEKNYETLEKTDSNVSERFEIFTDSGDDTNSKKVMFSKTDLVNPDNSAGLIITSPTEGSESDERLQDQSNPQNNKFNIIFAEPNEKLLSYADESWPTDFSDKPLLKVSESASKSVSSLGKITENDEKQMSPDEEDNESDKGTGDPKLKVNAIMEKLDTMFPKENHDTASQSNEAPIKVSPETSTSEPKTVSQVNSKLINENDNGISDVKPDDESSKLENHQTDVVESNLLQTGSTDIREDEATRSPRRQSQMCYGWKVHLKTAPSWVTSWGQDRGEPSEDSSIKNQKSPTKVTEYELRKWCKELEKAFKNLEMWSNWISATCKESLLLMKQKEFGCPALAQKGTINRIRHKRDVRKDALLWTKLYQRTENNFKSLKRKYNNIEYSSDKPTPIFNETAFDMICEFENHSMELHKMIVAAEYCAVCNCDKTKTRYNFK